MIQGQLRRLIILFILLVVVQVPMLHNWVFYGVAFPLPYVGFLLLLPHTINRTQTMLAAFFIGMVMDVFSNTPGMHMFTSILIAYMRPWMIETMTDSTDIDRELSLGYLGFGRWAIFILPLVLVHHFILFTLENEGFERIGQLLSKVGWSTLVSFLLILLGEFLTVTKKQRA